MHDGWLDKYIICFSFYLSNFYFKVKELSLISNFADAFKDPPLKQSLVESKNIVSLLLSGSSGVSAGTILLTDSDLETFVLVLTMGAIFLFASYIVSKQINVWIVRLRDYFF